MREYLSKKVKRINGKKEAAGGREHLHLASCSKVRVFLNRMEAAAALDAAAGKERGCHPDCTSVCRNGKRWQEQEQQQQATALQVRWSAP